jgi:hypothetical protein
MAGWKEGREDEPVQINGRICLFSVVGFLREGGGGEAFAFAACIEM